MGACWGTIRHIVLVLLVLTGLGVAGCIGNEGQDTVATGDDQDQISETATATNATPQLQGFTWETSHDYLTEGPGEVTFDVPERAYAEGIEIDFTGPPPGEMVNACLGLPAARAILEDPSGDTVAEASVGIAVSSGGIGCGASFIENGLVRLAPGTWTVVFEGQGTVTGHVVLGPR